MLQDYKTIPVLVLTGYLGSGKTTLLNHILQNQKGIKFAVIVNDIGEVNIDVDLIQKGGVVDTQDDSLMALQNGCICCTLKMDLIKQIEDIVNMKKFDYIVIEASGASEPEPIAQTLVSVQQASKRQYGFEVCRLDCVCTVVDALRMQSEFACGEDLNKKRIDEEDIENLIIQQIEFCNLILLNKVSEVSPEELGRIKNIIKTLQPYAEIIECDYANVDVEDLINTRHFDLEKNVMSAGWIKEMERDMTEEEEKEARADHHHEHTHHHDHDHDHECDDPNCSCHHHHDHDHDHECDDPNCSCHHHHDHDHDHDHECDDPNCSCHHHHHNKEVGEYGIGTFVYYRRGPFDAEKFDKFVSKNWSKNIIRSKGICYFTANEDMSYVFEQAGVQKNLQEAGQWYCTAPKDELEQIIARNPDILKDWDEKYGDRMQKIVFIGQRMDKESIIRELDACLA